MAAGSVFGEQVYSPKAEYYAKYRWSYAPEAVTACFEIAGLGAEAVLADLGAGTGILTRALCARAGLVYALEPNPEMRAFLGRNCASLSNCRILPGPAEATGLPEVCLDMAAAAQAIHWFDPAPARKEIARILKPGGWLAVFENGPTDDELEVALQAIYTSENGVQRPPSTTSAARTPLDFYYGGSDYRRLVFPFEFRQPWESFLGAQLSTSYTPVPGQPGYPRFEAAARKVFERFCQDGTLALSGETNLTIGRVAAI